MNENKTKVTIDIFPVVMIIFAIGLVIAFLSFIGAVGNMCEFEIEANAKGKFDFNVSPSPQVKEMVFEEAIIKVKTEMPCTQVTLLSQIIQLMLT